MAAAAARFTRKGSVAKVLCEPKQAQPASPARTASVTNGSGPTAHDAQQGQMQALQVFWTTGATFQLIHCRAEATHDVTLPPLAPLLGTIMAFKNGVTHKDGMLT